MNGRKLMNRKTILTTAILIALAILASVRAFAGPHEVIFDPKEKKVSLKADKAKVKDLLDDLAAKSGIEINADREITEEISIDLPPTDIEDGIRRVLEKAKVKDWDFGYYFNCITKQKSFVSVQFRDYETPGRVKRPEKGNLAKWNTSKKGYPKSKIGNKGLDVFNNEGKVTSRIQLDRGGRKWIVKSPSELSEVVDERIIDSFKEKAKIVLENNDEHLQYSIVVGDDYIYSTSETDGRFIVFGGKINSLTMEPRTDTNFEPVLLVHEKFISLYDLDFKEIFRRNDFRIIGSPKLSPKGKYLKVSTYGLNDNFSNVNFDKGQEPQGVPRWIWILNERGEKVLEWNESMTVTILESVFSPNDKYLSFVTRENEIEVLNVYDLQSLELIFHRHVDGVVGFSSNEVNIDEESRLITINIPYSEQVSVKF